MTCLTATHIKLLIEGLAELLRVDVQIPRTMTAPVCKNASKLFLPCFYEMKHKSVQCM